MGKRILAGVLWFFAIAYLWNVMALVLGLSDVPGLFLGASAAVLFAGDPLHRIWAARRPITTTQAAAAVTTPA